MSAGTVTASATPTKPLASNAWRCARGPVPRLRISANATSTHSLSRFATRTARPSRRGARSGPKLAATGRSQRRQVLFYSPPCGTPGRCPQQFATYRNNRGPIRECSANVGWWPRHMSYRGRSARSRQVGTDEPLRAGGHGSNLLLLAWRSVGNGGRHTRRAGGLACATSTNGCCSRG